MGEGRDGGDVLEGGRGVGGGMVVRAVKGGGEVGGGGVFFFKQKTAYEMIW